MKRRSPFLLRYQKEQREKKGNIKETSEYVQSIERLARFRSKDYFVLLLLLLSYSEATQHHFLLGEDNT